MQEPSMDSATVAAVKRAMAENSASRSGGPPGPTLVPLPNGMGAAPPQPQPAQQMVMADRVELAQAVLPMNTPEGQRDVPVVVFRFGAGGQYPFPNIVVPAEAMKWDVAGEALAAAGAAAMALVEDVEAPVVEAGLCPGCQSKIFGPALARGACFSCVPKTKDES